MFYIFKKKSKETIKPEGFRYEVGLMKGGHSEMCTKAQCKDSVANREKFDKTCLF